MDVVAIPFHDWVKLESEGWVRRDTQIIQELRGRPDVKRLLMIDRPSSFPIMMRAVARGHGWRARAGTLFAAGVGWWVRQLDDKLFVLDILIPDLTQTLRFGRSWWSRALAERRTRGAVLDAYAALGIHQPVVWCFTPLGAPLAASLPRQALVFDAIDDWLEHPEMGSYRDAARAGYEVARREADLVTCVARDLQLRFEGARAPVRWIPNGIGPEFLQHCASLPPDLVRIRGPRAGYVGVIEKRIDIPLLLWLSDQMPHVQFCFVGPYDRDHVAPLLHRPNCHFLGKRDFSLMPSYIAGFDVCLLPHVVDNSTRRMNPLKLYEYLALGKPVVATRVAGVELFPDLVSVADTPGQFVVYLQSALQDPQSRESADMRRAAVESCSWSNRVDQMLDELQLVLADDNTRGPAILAEPCA
jgi:teichuronic acid biosynthesis glycosyltransferase TuaH